MNLKEWFEQPRFQEVLRVLSERRASDHDLEKTEGTLVNMLEEYPDDPVLVTAHGRLAARWAKLTEARDYYRRAQQLTDPAQYSSPWLNEAMLYKDFRFFRKAMVICQQILDKNPDDIRAQELHASCAGARKAIAIKYKLTSEDMKSGDPYVLDTLELLLAVGLNIVDVKGHVQDQVGLHREIDILAELPGLEFLGTLPLIIECKDWSRPVDRPVIDKCLSLVNHSKYKLCAVFSRAFSKDARKLASQSGVWLVQKDIFETSVETFFWKKLSLFPIYRERDFAKLAGSETLEEVHARRQQEVMQNQAKQAACNRLSLWLQNQIPKASCNVTIRREAVFVDGKEAISLPWGACGLLEETLPLEEHMFVKLLFLGYYKRIEKLAEPKWAR